jgi:pyruvate formate lyase activating enzyme
MPTLEAVLDGLTSEGELYQRLDGNRLRCLACGHRCPIPDGAAGVCKVRFNRGGRLMVPFGYVAGLQADPVEKKPFFHVLPGAIALSFGMLGCDLHCGYCQNWVTSQALRDTRAGSSVYPATPDEIVNLAISHGAQIVVSTYNEPLITCEWAVSVFKPAKQAGLITGFVSNGNGTEEVLRYLKPWVDLYKVDLKSFDDRQYRKLGGRLQPILDTIRSLHREGFWVEIVTLLVPGFNDSDEELKALTGFVAEVSPDIPWHVTAYHQDYKMANRGTSAADLLKAAEIGLAAGLRFVYAGNLPGRLKDLENTHCPGCRSLLVERRGYRILTNLVNRAGCCPSCSQPVPGIWSHSLPKDR